MLLYWGRRGFTQFVLELTQTALASGNVAVTLSVSRQNEAFASFQRLGALFPVDLYSSGYRALTQAWRIPSLRRDLVTRLKDDRTHAVIDLMPHVWSPFVMPSIRRAGVRYVAVAHDADPHPGDRTAIVKPIIDRAIFRADRVITLSHMVAERLLARGLSPAQLSVLFHPDLHFATHFGERYPPTPGTALRLLFLGRIMYYKGFSLFLDAVDLLRAERIPVALGVCGEGPLGALAGRLSAMHAEVTNRWLSAKEVGETLTRYDAVVCPHLECSQSGVVAAALGAGLPCVVTPVGGLVEQIEDGVTGVIAQTATASALAAAIKRLFFTPDLYRDICRNIAERRGQRSMRRFLTECVRIATDDI